MDQRTSSGYTLDNYSNLPLVVMEWHTTVEGLSLHIIKTMMPGEITVLYTHLMVVEADGGLVVV